MHHETKTFTLRFSLEASFPDEYEGDDDQYAWAAEWERRIKPELIKVTFDCLRRHPAWSAHVRNRGVSPIDEVEISLTRQPEAGDTLRL